MKESNNIYGTNKAAIVSVGSFYGETCRRALTGSARCSHGNRYRPIKHPGRMPRSFHDASRNAGHPRPHVTSFHHRQSSLRSCHKTARTHTMCKTQYRPNLRQYLHTSNERPTQHSDCGHLQHVQFHIQHVIFAMMPLCCRLNETTTD